MNDFGRRRTLFIKALSTVAQSRFPNLQLTWLWRAQVATDCKVSLNPISSQTKDVPITVPNSEGRECGKFCLVNEHENGTLVRPTSWNSQLRKIDITEIPTRSKSKENKVGSKWVDFVRT